LVLLPALEVGYLFLKCSFRWKSLLRAKDSNESGDFRVMKPAGCNLNQGSSKHQKWDGAGSACHRSRKWANGKFSSICILRFASRSSAWRRITSQSSGSTSRKYSSSISAVEGGDCGLGSSSESVPGMGDCTCGLDEGFGAGGLETEIFRGRLATNCSISSASLATRRSLSTRFLARSSHFSRLPFAFSNLPVEQ